MIQIIEPGVHVDILLVILELGAVCRKIVFKYNHLVCKVDLIVQSKAVRETIIVKDAFGLQCAVGKIVTFLTGKNDSAAY